MHNATPVVDQIDWTAKMKALLFPFTFLRPAEIDLLGALFDRVVVLRPCKSAAGQPVGPSAGVAAQEQEHAALEVCYPYAGGDEMVLNQAAAFDQWGHQQADLDLKQVLRGDAVPFFNDEATHAIASRIRGADGAPDNSDAAELHRFRCRLFLQIAHQLDVSRWEMARNMRQLDELEGDLNRSLHASATMGERPLYRQQTLDYGAFDAYMITERVDAWRDMAAAFLKRNAAPRHLVTTSRAVVDHVLVRLPQGRLHWEQWIEPDAPDFATLLQVTRERMAARAADTGAPADPAKGDFSAQPPGGNGLNLQLYTFNRSVSPQGVMSTDAGGGGPLPDSYLKAHPPIWLISL